MPDFGRWTGNGGDPSLNDINRADRFFDALATNQPVYSTDPGEAELAFLLSDWRDEVRDTPLTVTVTPRDAAIALRGSVDSSRRTRRSLALVGSVAAALLCLGGFSAAVYGAGPGDTFYGVRTMLFGDQPSSRDDQVMLASQELAQVQQLIEQGDWQQAQDKLVTLSTTVQNIDQVEQKQDLIQQWNALTYKVVEQDPAATLPPPGEPMPVLPSSPLTLLEVPVIEDTTTSTSTSPSDGSTSPSETTPPSDATTTTSAPATSTEPTTTTEPSTSTATPTSATTTTSSPPSTTTTTTVIVRQAPATATAPPTSVPAPPPASLPATAPASVPASAGAEAPASQPRIAATVTPSQAPVTTTTTVKPAEEPSQEAKSSEVPSTPPRQREEVVTTTTIVPPGSGN